MPDHCHVSLTCKYLYITSMCCIDACILFSAYTDSALLLFTFLDAWKTSPRSTTISSSVLLHVSAGCACLRRELCSVSRFALHRSAMPNIFLSCFLIFLVWLLSAAQHLTPAVACNSSFFYVYSCIIIVCV